MGSECTGVTVALLARIETFLAFFLFYQPDQKNVPVSVNAEIVARWQLEGATNAERTSCFMSGLFALSGP